MLLFLACYPGKSKFLSRFILGRQPTHTHTHTSVPVFDPPTPGQIATRANFLRAKTKKEKKNHRACVEAWVRNNPRNGWKLPAWLKKGAFHLRCTLFSVLSDQRTKKKCLIVERERAKDWLKLKAEKFLIFSGESFKTNQEGFGIIRYERENFILDFLPYSNLCMFYRNS